ncbi:hypothetical protein COLO4_08809 [Corchorus olitorius]|uniref:Sulfotransferase n=1 Tax=Corchorus olitorius TaxID=93759 RepID=A0A1R3KEL6_9ROSI|nr:hypothetical protein COLO4_08809 [Corchorus olitorius]
MSPMADEELSQSQTQNSPKFSTDLFQGFWHRPSLIPNIIAFQKHFQAHDNDIVIASKPKSGTTWLKSLVFTIVNRTRYSLSNTPLNTSNPHDLVPCFEYDLYKNQVPNNLTSISTPRLFSTHIPYSSLPESIKLSDCRIVYIARNPFDVIVSLWHFLKLPKPITLEECYEMFCRGEEPFGPYWDHVLEYWKESLERPNKVLFIKYEDMKEDPNSIIKNLADFIGFPISMEEEEMGIIEDILELCSLENLKNLKVNKEGKNRYSTRENKTYFRKGEVGDYVNYFSPSSIQRFSKIIEEKLGGSGLTFNMSYT